MRNFLSRFSLTNRFSFKLEHVFVGALLLFAFGAWIDTSIGSILRSAAFLPLVGFFPGHYLNLAFFRRRTSLLTDISFSLTSSLGLLLLVLVALKSSISLTGGSLSLLLIAINLVAFGGYLLSRMLLRKSTEEEISTPPFELLDWLILAIPPLLFFVNYFLNPVISEGDSYYFINAALTSFAAGSDISPYVNRPGFIPLLGTFNLAGHLDFHTIFKFVLPSLFYLSTLTLFDVIKQKSQQPTSSRLLYLLILAVPVIGSEVDIARPQSIAFAFTVPILLYLSSYLEKKSWKYFIAASFLIATLSLVHELAYLFALIALVSALAFFGSSFTRSTSKISWLKKHGKAILILVLILYPYWILFNGPEHIGLVIHAFRTTITQILHPDWQWWFLDSYASDGNSVGWKGIEAGKYYAYNGILVLIPLALFYLSHKRKRFSLYLVPFFAYFLLFFAIAEILPRFGIYFYPNRAWPHMMLGLWLFVLFVSFTTTIRHRLSTVLFTVSLTAVVLVGIVGWAIVSKSKGGFYSAKDAAILSYIKDELPQNAIIYSNQSATQAILPYYTGKDSGYLYYTTPWDSIEDIQHSLLVFDEELKRKNYLDSLAIYQTTILSYGIDDEIVSTTHKLIQDPRKPHIVYDPTRPGYLYYSFSRLEGVFGSREWWKSVNGYDTIDFFANVESADVVYRDPSGVILKIR